MVRYSDLVEYIKRNHVNWNQDLFDVLRGFFEEYSQPPSSPIPPLAHSYEEVELFMHSAIKPKESKDGEYTTQDLIDLFST